MNTEAVALQIASPVFARARRVLAKAYEYECYRMPACGAANRADAVALYVEALDIAMAVLEPEPAPVPSAPCSETRVVATSEPATPHEQAEEWRADAALDARMSAARGES